MSKIMIVDDDATIQMELEEYLTHMDYTVAGIADTGAGAVEMARKMKPDLILMDVNLPGEMDGISAARKIKTELDIPIVFITGYGNPEYIEKAKEIEPFGYVMKPFDEEEIRAFIEIALHKKAMELKLEKANEQLAQTNRELKQEIKERKQTEETLWESEALLSMAGRTARFGGWSAHPDGHEVMWSEQVALIHEKQPGYSPTVKEAIQYYAPEWRDKIAAVFQICAREGTPWDEEMEIITAGGHRLWVRSTGEAVRDNMGKIFRVEGSFQDITERKRAEEALRKEKEFSENLIDTAQVIILVLDTDGRIVRFNPYMEDLCGYKLDEVQGRDWFSVFLPEQDYDRIREVFQTAVGDIKTQGNINPIVTRDGREIIVEWYDKTLKDAAGNTIGLLAIGQNITSRKQSEEALRKSEEKYRSMMEAMTEPIYICSPDFRVTYMNPAMIRRTGYDATGEHCFKALHDLGEKCPWCMHDKAQHGEYLEFEIVSPKDNRSYSISQSPVAHGDGSVPKLAVFRDITEMRETEAQLQQATKMEAIATLAGGIAHEFNNALMGVMGNIELLKMDLPEDERRDKSFEAMKDSGHRMSRLTDQLLAYARGGKYQTEDLKLDDFVIGTLPILQHDLSPEVRVETHFLKVISYIRADHAQMQMVLSAVVANSNEAIEDEGIIRIAAENKDIDEGFTKQHPGLKSGSYVCLTIKDNGKGMDEETKDGMFEPFFTTKFQGRGMGMAAVYGIIKSHDGAIIVDSEPGKGTVVRIYFPAISAESKQEAKAVKQPKTEIAMGEGTILVIEDEEVLVKMFRQILERLGYRVLQAETGKEAVVLAKTFDGQIDLALLDIKLPDMDGGRVYPLIMEARPDLKVIVCSGYSIHGPAQDIIDAGAEGFMQKPFSIAPFAEKLKEVLEGK